MILIWNGMLYHLKCACRFYLSGVVAFLDYQVDAVTPVCPCPLCGQDMVIKTKKDGVG